MFLRRSCSARWADLTVSYSLVTDYGLINLSPRSESIKMPIITYVNAKYAAAQRIVYVH